MPRQQAMEDTAMPVGPVHHGRDGKSPAIERQRFPSFPSNLAHSVFARFALILALLTAFFEVEYDKSYRKSRLSYRITWTDWHSRARGYQWELSFDASAPMAPGATPARSS